MPPKEDYSYLTPDRMWEILTHSYLILPNGELSNPYFNEEDRKYVNTPELLKFHLLKSINNGYTEMPNIGAEVIGYAPLKLRTWYPMVHPYYNNLDKRFKYSGHSELGNENYNITKLSNEPDYNLVLNNCSDATMKALEAIFNKQSNTFGFTTPGDVRDFALENGGIPHVVSATIPIELNRLIYIPMNKERYERLKQYSNASYSK